MCTRARSCLFAWDLFIFSFSVSISMVRRELARVRSFVDIDRHFYCCRLVYFLQLHKVSNQLNKPREKVRERESKQVEIEGIQRMRNNNNKFRVFFRQ